MADVKPNKFNAIKKPKLNLKISVAVALLVTFISFTAILVAGLFVPKSVLVKLSLDKQSAKANVESSQLANNADNSASTATSAQDQSQTTSDKSTQTQTSTNATTPSTSNGNTTTTGGSAPTTPTAPTTPASSGTAAVAPTLTFSGSPTTITAGSSTVLSWSISNSATPTPTCTAGGAWSGSKATSGSQSVSPASTSSYTLVCANTGGTSGTKTVTITVNAAAAACGAAGGSCTAAQVAAHNSSANCWVIYSGSYYVLSGANLPSGKSAYPNIHNGGSGAFTSSTCGQDITAYMNGTSNAGTTVAKHAHSGSAYTTLNSYKVGPVN